MILLDTHVFIWWLDGNKKLSDMYVEMITQRVSEGIGVSIISLWEIAKLHENGRIAFDCPVDEWLEKALQYPGVVLLDLNVPIVLESTRLPGSFHQDPADQLIVATARILDVPLMTLDSKITEYPHVRLLK